MKWKISSTVPLSRGVSLSQLHNIFKLPLQHTIDSLIFLIKCLNNPNIDTPAHFNGTSAYIFNILPYHWVLIRSGMSFDNNWPSFRNPFIHFILFHQGRFVELAQSAAILMSID